MKISVALCCYGDAPFLEEQVDSILAQSIPIDSVNIFNDGLTPHFFHVLGLLKNKYPEVIKINNNESRKGLVNNFNAAISQCDGEYIFLSDQDDVWKANKVELMLAEFQKPEKIDLVFSNAIITNETLQISSCTSWDRNNFNPDKYSSSDDFFFRLLNSHVVTGATAAIRASAREYLLPMPDLFPVHLHDGWIALACAAKGRVSWVDESLIYYRQHSQQTLGSVKKGGLKWFLSRIEGYWTADNKNWRGRLNAEAKSWTEAKEILDDRNLLSSPHKKVLQDKIDFLMQRSERTSFLKKLMICKQLWLQGEYKRFHHRPVGALITDIIQS